MTIFLSNKLKTISFFSIIMIVILHSYNLTPNVNSGFIFYVEKFVSDGICRIAVPLFFAISGYLFFYNHESSFSWYVRKFKKRVISLVIPYFFWVILGIILFYFIQLFPLSHNFFKNKLISEYNIWDFVKSIFLYPIPYQFWFIKDLFFLILLTPIIYYLVKLLNFIFPLTIFVLWFANFYTPLILTESLAFFSFGCLLSLKKINLEYSLNYKLIVTGIAFWILFNFIKLQFFSTNINLSNFFEKISILVGFITFWSLFDWFKFENFDSKLPEFSFFIFASHEPILTIIKKSLLYFLGSTSLNLISVYIIAPIITIVIVLSIGIKYRKNLPKLFYLSTGNR